MTALGLLLQLLFPLLDPASQWTGLAVVNASTQSNTVTVEWTDGARSDNASFTLPAGGQRIALISEIFAGRVLGQGSLRVGGTSELRAVLTSGTADALDTIDGVLTPSPFIWLPAVRLSTGFRETDYTDTRITIVNPGTSAAAVTAQLVDLFGQVRASASFPVGSRSTFSALASLMFNRSLTPNAAGGFTFDGYVRLVSDASVAAWATFERPLNRSTFRGLSGADFPAASQWVLPHFVFGGLSFSSSLQLLNPTDVPITVELTAVDEQGRTLGSPATFNIPPHGVFRGPAGAIFRIPVIAIFPPPIITGYVRIRPVSGQAAALIAGMEYDFDVFGVRAAAAAVYTRAPLRSAIVPVAVQNNDFYTGLAIANVNELLAVQTDVQIDVIAPDGRPAGPPVTLSLSPATRRTLMLNVPGGVGYLRITSSSDISLTTVLGSADNRSLAAIP